MFVTYREYLSFGYSAIPADKFPRFIYRAGALAEALTLGRVTVDFLNDADADAALAERNKRGISEIAELMFSHYTQAIGEAGLPIKSFTNNGYSETYADGESGSEAYQNALITICSTFFTREQLFRGV